MHRILNKICSLEETLLCWAESACDEGIATVDADEMGKVADMIKDLAEAKEKCWKSKYYETIVHAMERGEENPEFHTVGEMGEPDSSERYGYDNWRYSSGRYAPKGHGHKVGRRGYVPEYDENMVMASEYGMPYIRYKNAKMGYHESGTPEMKHEMDSAAEEHVHSAMETMRDVWTDSDPQMRSKMKIELSKLSREFGLIE